jgi:putative heme-binding domain-containing protein
MKRLVPALLPLLTTTALAQRGLKEIPSTDPSVEQATFQLAPGLEVNLFAKDPMIAKPIQMAWDEKGRLWVASSAIYPHIKPGQEQTDKIVVLEDTDGDGTADKSTVFFEGLLIPTGILPGDGGAYVANSTELLFMKDTNGDGRADETKVLLSGFGTEDTHHILHGFKRGPDGSLYLIQSVYIHAHIETPFGVRRLMGSGIWQYWPETGRLEVFSMGQVNPWGHIFDKWGQSFTTDGAFGEGINYTFPGATFFCLPNQRPRILKGLNPGQPKHCGLEVISGRHFPDDWQGDLITNDFRGHRVNRFKISDQNSGYASRQMEDVIRSNHGSFRPVDVKMGPDGALYIADWYNPIIQHGEVDFRDERRDHVHGRIWRVSAKGREKSPKVDFASKSVPEVIALLKEPEQWVRLEAKQELKRRKPADLAKLLTDFILNAENLHQAIEGLWAAETAVPEKLEEIIKGSEGRKKESTEDEFRGTAAFVRLLRNVLLDLGHDRVMHAGMPNYWGSLAGAGHPRVRLEAVNLLREAGTAKAVEYACKVLDQPMDENLDFALWLTCSELADVWLPAFQKGEINFGGNVAHIAYALKAANKPEAVGTLQGMLNDAKMETGRKVEIIRLVGALGNPEQLRLLGVRFGDVHTTVDEAVAICEALTAAARQRGPNAVAAVDRGLLVNELLQPLPNSARQRAAAILVGVMKVQEARPQLENLAGSGDQELSRTGIAALAELGGDKSRDFLAGLLSKDHAIGVKPDIIAALVNLNPQAAAGESVAFLSSLSDPAPASRVFDTYLARKDGPAILAGALKGAKIPSAIATAGVQKASATGGDNKALIEALTIAGGLQPVMALTPEEVTKMMAEVKTSGDPARGELIYRRANLQCMNCHAIGAVGGIVGPDMVSIGASAPVDYIIDSLLEPSKKIKEGYATTMLTTKDGGIHSGFLVRTDDREVILRDAAGKTESVPAASVAKQENIPVSLMPPALTATLRRDEFVDLVRFLSELGKEGGYKIQEDGTLRRWRTAQAPNEAWRWMNLKGNKGFHEAAGELTWLPLYSRVDGTVHGEDASLIAVGKNEWRAIESEIEVSAAGKIGLRLNDPAGLQIFIAGKELPAAADMQTDVPAGKVRVTLLFDSAARKAPVKMQVYDLPGSPAKTKAVLGV